MNTTEHTDVFLFGKIEKGCQGAFNIFFHRHYQQLIELSFGLIRCRPSSEEVVNEKFMHIWENRHLLQNVETPLAYMRRVVRNGSLDRLKKNAYKNVHLDEVKHVADTNCVEGQIHFEELYVNLKELINQLPPRRKMIYNLNKFEGLPYQKIADKLGISVHTVQKQMSLATDFMEKEFEKFREHG
ncbi:sigma-70 family RNA polymerase sigma factor [Aureibacter tunicatorum]|uniref:RNA polymerase sigma-70 factor (ECF subfamily) n=1 Tax=Aureibacter tunicatorum TaxID=866807 RepID=A0AAE4BU61_9BACT|nr:sigma-70 family RNA polymerase sigma factor [Aureibacter tunicatorum]MDR6241466.1 RNA polymerase sigma-70 factor (ECF subfamily) [Aureibacter tunicatorum]BDD06691.1 RNA polymerase sigma-70 factor [Aureibacter tunicatorum]